MTTQLKPIAAAVAAGATLGLVTPSVFAQLLLPTNPIMFDADGKAAANGAQEVQTFDWAVSSLLTTGGPCPSDSTGKLLEPCNQSLPIADLTTPSYLKSITHAALHGYLDRNGNPAGAPVGLNTTFEITFVAGACVKAQPVGAIAPGVPGTLNFTLNPSSGCIVDGNDPLDPKGERKASGQFFEVWFDDFTVGAKSDALAGTGYRDGKLILSGSVTELSGSSSTTDLTFNVFDQYINNDYPGVTTLVQEGSDTIVVQINALDKDFFRSGVDVGSLLPFTGQAKTPYNQTNPSKNFYTGGDPVLTGTTTTIAPDHAAAIGAINFGPDTEQQADASNSWTFVSPPLACRVTGGGNDTSGLNATLDGYDGTVATAKLTPTKQLKFKGKKTSAVTPSYFYSFGGQAGANTALPPQPKGQWEHNQHSSPTGLQFAFHGGKNAPAGTQIDEIRCTDPGWCVQARPAPDKQIDFTGIGTFSNISGNTSSGDGVVFPGIETVVPEPKTGQPGQPVPTYHWFQVHIQDAGEPGSQANEPGANCPPRGSGNDPFANPAVTSNIADCGCADFYRITIYKGVLPAVDSNGEVILDGNGDIPGIDKTNKIYEVFGYIDGGNFQIHPLTGFDLH